MSEIFFNEYPLYSHEYDVDYPSVARAFKDSIAVVDAVLFVTPEYNRSIPGERDRLGKPPIRAERSKTIRYRRNVARSDRHGRCSTKSWQCARFLQLSPNERSRSVHSVTSDLINDDGAVSVESTEKFLRNFVTNFHAFIGRMLQVLPQNA